MNVPPPGLHQAGRVMKQHGKFHVETLAEEQTTTTHFERNITRLFLLWRIPGSVTRFDLFVTSPLSLSERKHSSVKQRDKRSSRTQALGSFSHCTFNKEGKQTSD